MMLRDKLNVVEESLESQLTCILEKYGRDDNDVHERTYWSRYTLNRRLILADGRQGGVS